MFYRANTNKYGLEVVVDTTSDANFARTSGLNYVETSGSPNIGDYIHEDSFIGVDSPNYNVIAEKIRVAEAERTAQEGIEIPEPQPEGEVNLDPDPAEQVIPELEEPTIPVGSNGEVPEDGAVYFDESLAEIEVDRLKKELDWVTELTNRVSSSSVDSDNPKLIVFDPPVNVVGQEETLERVEFMEDDKDSYLATIIGAKEKTQAAYDLAVAKAAELASSE